MLSVSSVLRWFFWVVLTAIASTVVLSQVSFASTVRVCHNLKQSRHVETGKQAKQKRVYCSIKPNMGKVGDFVEIKNQYNYIVAVGRIIKQQRSSSWVVLTKYDPTVGSMTGFPVMVRSRDSQDFWTATSAPF
ncbi:MAG: hypothetical protein ACOH5I_05975 [Oligoflexus sp.]